MCSNTLFGPQCAPRGDAAYNVIVRDRVADIDLISPRFVAVAPGEEVRVGELLGRVRRYDLDTSDGEHHAATGIAVSRPCDLLVAVAQGRGEAMAVQRAALAFLGTQEMKRWMVAALDGR